MARRALLVANDTYRDPALRGLISPESDAVELGELLGDRRIGGFDDVDVHLNESKLTIEKSIERLFHDAEPEDLVLLYFSGHGVRDRHRRLYFTVPRTELRSGLAATSVSASFVKQCIADSNAEAVVLLLDCCYSGLFIEEGLKAASQPGMSPEHQALASGRGVYVLTATDAIQEAADGTYDATGLAGQSIFTSVITQGLRTGEADVRNQGRITLDDLWEYVHREMRNRTELQTPTQFGVLEAPIELAQSRAPGAQRFLETSSRLSLGELTGDLDPIPTLGLRATRWAGSGRLIVPIGHTVDNDKHDEAVSVSLGERGGHILAVGKIGSGKSTLLRTLACSLAMTHSPDEASFAFLESGGNKLGSLQELPHVQSALGDDEPENVTSFLDQTENLIRARKLLFRKHGLVSTAHFRRSRDFLPEGPHPDLVIFVDQWSDFAMSVPRFTRKMERLINVGREFGVHLVVATRRPTDLTESQRELFDTYIELRLPDPARSLINPNLSRRLPESDPGWALINHTRFRIAQPFLSGTSEMQLPYVDGAEEIVEEISRHWRAQSPPVSRKPAKQSEPDTRQHLPSELLAYRPGDPWMYTLKIRLKHLIPIERWPEGRDD